MEAAAAKYSFAIDRDGDYVRFSGFGIVGEIRVENDIATVVLNHRPFFLPESLIEAKVRAFLLTQY